MRRSRRSWSRRIDRQAPICALHSAFARQDWHAALDTLAPDFVYQDHRTLGMGALDRSQWIESLRTLG